MLAMHGYRWMHQYAWCLTTAFCCLYAHQLNACAVVHRRTRSAIASRTTAIIAVRCLSLSRCGEWSNHHTVMHITAPAEFALSYKYMCKEQYSNNNQFEKTWSEEYARVNFCATMITFGSRNSMRGIYLLLTIICQWAFANVVSEEHISKLVLLCSYEPLLHFQVC